MRFEYLRRKSWMIVLAVSMFVLHQVANKVLADNERSTSPNIVLIVSDDQGYRDLGCFGSQQCKTPHLDRLASDGVRLTSFYVAWPACTPSRGALLTGRYPQRNGTYDMFRNEAPDMGHLYSPEEYSITWERIGGMDSREILLPQVLSKAGYKCGVFGKWDLGMSRRFLPLQRGFDDFYGFVNSGIDYFTHERYGVGSMYRGNDPVNDDWGQYATDLFLRESLRFLKENHDRPFFLYVPFNAPHSASNLDPKIRGAAQGTDDFKKLYPELLEHDDQFRETIKYGKPAQSPTKENRRLEYLSAVSCMDDAIGKILDALNQHKVADNTIVIFFSDNGGGGDADNSPLRGGKSRMWEGGLRVPCIIRWPGKIEPGSERDDFLTSLEIFPTIVKTAGIEFEDAILDGFDMLPVVTDNQPSPRNEMYWQRREDKAARFGKWKWVESKDGSGVFDLSNDIGEKNDLSESRPDVLKDMRQRFAKWKAAMDSADPRGPFRDY